MFSSLLYSNPIKAILREYSTNARDSHVEAGTERPFDVQLPSARHPMFMIRDYGTGMSPERIETICNTYGASTKRDTNQSTGKFGLGFKSALSYVKSFGVFSYYNGKVYKYLVALNDKKIPELLTAPDSPNDTDEPNGVKIQLSVAVGDVENFKATAEEVYPYFEMQPNFVGSAVPTIKFPEYVLEHRQSDFTWKVKREKNQYYAKSRIIMGSNCYPLPTELANVYDDDGIDYYVDIDMFEPTPAREALHWSNEDIAQFKKIQQETAAEIVKVFQEETKGMSRWQQISHLQRTYANSMVVVLIEKYLKGIDGKKQTLQNKTYHVSFGVDADFVIAASGMPMRVVAAKEIGSGKKLIANKTSPNSAVFQGDKWPGLLSIIVYDAPGLNRVIHNLPKQTIVLGTFGADPKLDDLLDLLDAEKIPYEVTKLSDLLPKNTAVSIPGISKKELSGCQGVFELTLAGDTFRKVEDIARYQYYVPFESENKFTLTEFFNQGSTVSWIRDPDAISRPWLKLRKTGYYDIARALDMPNPDFRVCYIRPRFVAAYADSVKPLYETLLGYLRKKYTDNWHGFVTMLRRSPDEIPLSERARGLLAWIKQCGEAWSYRRITYPLTARIYATFIQHRYDPHHLASYDDNGKQVKVLHSDQAQDSLNDYETLTKWTFRPAVFAEIYKDWLDKFNNEAASMLRTFPYLFKDKQQLLYNALVQRSEHFKTERNET
jgi:hypothetical protein